MGFKSRDWLGFWSYFGGMFGVVEFSFLTRFTFLTAEMKFSSNMSQYFTPFMFPSVICNVPVVFGEK